MDENRKECTSKQELYKTLVRVKSITMAGSNTDDNWGRRKKNVGKLGLMTIYTIMQGEHKGKVVVKLSGEANLQTSAGTLEKDGDIITVRTKQTVYVFEVTDYLPDFFAGINDY